MVENVWVRVVLLVAMVRSHHVDGMTVLGPVQEATFQILVVLVD